MRKGKMVKTKPEMFDKATRNIAGRIRTQNREHEKADEATRVRVRQYDYDLRLRVRGRVRQANEATRSEGSQRRHISQAHSLHRAKITLTEWSPLLQKAGMHAGSS